MYWYQFSEREEVRAIAQAEAQSKAAGRDPDDLRKYVGNLGEIAVNAFFEQMVTDGDWEYLHAEEMERAEPEYGKSDFQVSHTEVDVKSTTDVRKFDPGSMVKMEGTPTPRSGYPAINPDDESDVYIFVLISEGPGPSPTESSPNIDNVELGIVRERLEEASGDKVAAILGWMYSREMHDEFIYDFNQRSVGEFTRMPFRDLYELLFRTGVNAKEE